MLVYVKASLTGDEPPDLQQYARRDPTFPHQTTADQFFDETQFESYRALGYHIAHEVFQDVATSPWATRGRRIRWYSRELRNRWFPAPPELEANFEKVAEAFVRLQEDMRSDHNLRALTHDLYPELGRCPRKMPSRSIRSTVPVPSSTRSTRSFVLMEKAWTAVKLEGFPEHPMNRGWMNQFRRCTSAETLRRLWPILRGGYANEFVRFCEEELMLPRQELEFTIYDASNEAHRRAYRAIRDEFAREWTDSLASLDESFNGVEKPPTGAPLPRSLRVADSGPSARAFRLCPGATETRESGGQTARPRDHDLGSAGVSQPADRRAVLREALCVR